MMTNDLDALKTRLIGNKRGSLTVVEYAGVNYEKQHSWNCVCDCGRKVCVRTALVDLIDAKCAGCKIREQTVARAKQSPMIGQRFSKLEVLGFSGITKYGLLIWRCRCDCGKESDITNEGLVSGRTKSCGCWARENLINRTTVHGLHRHPLYSVWWAMKDRCYKSNHKAYHRYGGRGITVCEEWLNDFKNFYDWAIKKGYRRGLTIERENNDGNYEPNNCKWTTMDEQVQNSSLAKMNPDRVRNIRKDPRPNSAIALEYNTNESTISRIKARTTWKNVV